MKVRIRDVRYTSTKVYIEYELIIPKLGKIVDMLEINVNEMAPSITSGKKLLYTGWVSPSKLPDLPRVSISW